jgi:hypothetical protein
MSTVTTPVPAGRVLPGQRAYQPEHHWIRRGRPRPAMLDRFADRSLVVTNPFAAFRPPGAASRPA